MRKVFLVLTAGGSGLRMGTRLPKQFLPLDGKPVLRCTMERFMEAVPDIQIITVLPEEYRSYWKEYCTGAGFNCPQRLVQGGFTRFHSVKNALSCVPDGAIVAVHDGVRPLISAKKISELVSLAMEVPALIPVMPSVETLVSLEKGDGGKLVPTGEKIDRSRVFGAQTPQLFHSELLKQAYNTLGYDTSFTDDASVAAAYGIPLTFTEGERYNIKITTPEDLELARAILSLSQSRPE